MAMHASEIESLIQAAFPDATIMIEDLRGDGEQCCYCIELEVGIYILGGI